MFLRIKVTLDGQAIHELAAADLVSIPGSGDTPDYSIEAKVPFEFNGYLKCAPDKQSIWVLVRDAAALIAAAAPRH